MIYVEISVKIDTLVQVVCNQFVLSVNGIFTTEFFTAGFFAAEFLPLDFSPRGIFRHVTISTRILFFETTAFETSLGEFSNDCF